MAWNWSALTAEEAEQVESTANPAEMWRCPPDILGKYCALDCEATYLIYNHVLKPAVDRFNGYAEYHAGPFMTLEKLLTVQMLTGIRIKKEELDAFYARLVEEVARLRSAFLTLPDVRAGVRKINQEVLNTHIASKPEQYKKRKPLGPEPEKYKKDGGITARWERWEETRKQYLLLPAEEQVRYIKWREVKERLEYCIANYDSVDVDELKELGLFNMGSPIQKQTLFYDVMGFPALVWTKPPEGGTPQRSTDADAMMGFGAAGKAFMDYAEREKTRQMVESLMNVLIQHDDTYPCDKDGNWYYHPQLKVPGTLTGRLSGSGGISCQNPVKDKEYMSTWTHREGRTLLDCDFVALEPVVLTELSRDSAMLKLYGPGAKPNDVYLMVGMTLPGIKEKFAACGYDPDNPTPEAIARCKKQHKDLRSVCKVVELSGKYGSGAAGWRSKLAVEGFNYSLAQCKEMHVAYWNLYSGVKKYERHLQQLWEKNQGWVLNGVGRPVCIDKFRIKDIVNACVSGDTLVWVKSKGLIPIRSVQKEDIVWTGSSWAAHMGLLFKGKRATVTVAGVNFTPDHKIYTKRGDCIDAGTIINRLEDIEEGSLPRADWRQVWGLANSLINLVAETGWLAIKKLCRCAM